MPLIFVPENFSRSVLDKLKKLAGAHILHTPKTSRADFLKKVPRADVLVVRSGTRVDKEALEKAKKLKLIIRAGVGVDNIDLPTATKLGIPVANTPGGNTHSTAELTLTLILSFLRNIGPAYSALANGKWDRAKFRGVELRRKTVGIVGLGRIGKALAEKLRGFEVRTLGYDPFLGDNAYPSHVQKAGLKALLKESDIVTFHVPLTSKTRHILGKETFKFLKKNAIVINCARGGVVDEKELLKAVESGKIKGAALDVFEEEPLPEFSPLRANPSILVTPHLGASTDEAQEEVSMESLGIIEKFLDDGRVQNCINFPFLGIKLEEWMKVYLHMAYYHAKYAMAFGGEEVREFEIITGGEGGKVSTSLLSTSLLTGYLEDLTEEKVSPVTAINVAAERGIKIRLRHEEEETPYKGFLRVRALGGGSHSKIIYQGTATVFGGTRARMVSLFDRPMEFPLGEGTYLFVRNKDKPGVVGKLGSLLGKSRVNIAGLYLGRTGKGETAISIYELDQEPTAAVLKKIMRMSEITETRVITVPNPAKKGLVF